MWLSREEGQGPPPTGLPTVLAGDTLSPPECDGGLQGGDLCPVPVVESVPGLSQALLLCPSPWLATAVPRTVITAAQQTGQTRQGGGLVTSADGRHRWPPGVQASAGVPASSGPAWLCPETLSHLDLPAPRNAVGKLGWDLPGAPPCSDLPWQTGVVPSGTGPQPGGLPYGPGLAPGGVRPAWVSPCPPHTHAPGPRWRSEGCRSWERRTCHASCPLRVHTGRRAHTGRLGAPVSCSYSRVSEATGCWVSHV